MPLSAQRHQLSECVYLSPLSSICLQKMRGQFGCFAFTNKLQLVGALVIDQPAVPTPTSRGGGRRIGWQAMRIAHSPPIPRPIALIDVLIAMLAILVAITLVVAAVGQLSGVNLQHRARCFVFWWFVPARQDRHLVRRVVGSPSANRAFVQLKLEQTALRARLNQGEQQQSEFVTRKLMLQSSLLCRHRYRHSLQATTKSSIVFSTVLLAIRPSQLGNVLKINKS